MGTIKCTGLDTFMKELSSLGGKADRMARYALYGGAEVVADSVKAAIATIPEQTFHYVNPGTVDNTHPPSTERLSGAASNIISAMQSGYGISTMRSNGGKEEAVLGFGGYISLDGNQVPVAELARSIESGSSVRQKTPFARPAVNKAKANAQKSMQQRADEYIKNFNL